MTREEFMKRWGYHFGMVELRAVRDDLDALLKATAEAQRKACDRDVRRSYCEDGYCHKRYAAGRTPLVTEVKK